MSKPSKRDWERIFREKFVVDKVPREFSGVTKDGVKFSAYNALSKPKPIKRLRSDDPEPIIDFIAHIREEAVEERDKQWVSIISDIAKEFPTLKLFAQWLSLEVESRLKKLLSALKPKESR